MNEIAYLINNRRNNDLYPNMSGIWRIFTDSVMGGISNGQLLPAVIAKENCLHLTGAVSLANNGGFLQASLDLSESAFFDASSYQGIEIDVYGNGEIYNMHLRTRDTQIVWQSYRASFQTQPNWQHIRLAFSDFSPYRIVTPLNRSCLRRLGIVAIGREIQADIAFANLRFYP